MDSSQSDKLSSSLIGQPISPTKSNRAKIMQGQLMKKRTIKQRALVKRKNSDMEDIEDNIIYKAY
jgi:hypothetical protein